MPFSLPKVSREIRLCFSGLFWAVFFAVLFVASLRTRAAVPDVAKSIEKKIVLPNRGISAHRGASETHPENTLAAFREAIRLGAHQIEFDIHLTSDKKLVVIHDPTVARTTDGPGEVAKMTLAQIKKLDAGSWKLASLAGERVPTFDEALAMMPRDIWLNCHLKGGPELAQAVTKTIVQAGREHQAFLACGHQAASAAREVFPDILICNMQRQGRSSEYVRATIDNNDAFIQLFAAWQTQKTWHS